MKIKISNGSETKAQRAERIAESNNGATMRCRVIGDKRKKDPKYKNKELMEE